MKLSLIREQAGTPGWLLTLTRLALIFMAVFLSLPVSAATTKQKTFTSPEKAVQALVASLKNADKSTVIAVLGPNSEQLISSGDPVADRRMRERFLSAYDEKQRLDREGKSKAVLVIGKNDWPFPIPIVKNKNLWRFDSRAGSQEIIYRRIGANELDTIQTCRAFIDAQLEYAMDDYDGDGLLEYAAKFLSDPGKKNGLYWQTGEGESPSPLGELFAKARAEGYSEKNSEEGPSPYHGYIYRILTGQGKHAEGGAYDYMVKGHLLGGIALIAVPAQYSASGVMTFIVNHDGVVYQKDLGRKTAEIASAIKLFDPGPDWQKVGAPAVK
jgi:hypothetical protein